MSIGDIMGMDQLVAGFQQQVQDSVAKIDRPSSEMKRDFHSHKSSHEHESFSDVVREVQDRDNPVNDKVSQVKESDTTQDKDLDRNDNSEQVEKTSHDGQGSENTETDNNDTTVIDPLIMNPDIAQIAANLNADSSIENTQITTASENTLIQATPELKQQAALLSGDTVLTENTARTAQPILQSNETQTNNGPVISSNEADAADTLLSDS
ncbi:MAG: hypothetical protein HRU15_09995, partial [Planctomycetes bacterium]|nr:hypothetical protein [Planctomycetota bacterium]